MPVYASAKLSAVQSVMLVHVLGGLGLLSVCVWLCCAAAGGASDTEYESYDDEDDERRTVYVNDAEHWQPISDHEEIRLPQ